MAKHSPQILTSKSLVFGKGLLWATLTGEKTFTVRKYREGAHDFKMGDVITGIFMDGLSVALEVRRDTIKKPFRELLSPKRDWEKRGYYFDKAYFESNKRFPGYEDTTWDTMGAVILIKVFEISHCTAVRFNEHADKNEFKISRP